jgi:hypothetical protein
MAKFDLSNVTLAFKNASAAEESFALMCEDMKAWHAAGEFPANKDLGAAILEGLSHLSASTVKVYASRMLAWARIGKTPRSLHVMCKDGPKAVGKGGRPKGEGKGKGKEEEANADAAADAPVVPNDDKAWAQFIGDIRAKVPGRKDWTSDDIVAMQECCAKMIALIKRNAK